MRPGRPSAESRSSLTEHENKIEVFATILLSVTTLLAAWAGYQSSRWHGEQAKAQAKATANRIEATRISAVAYREGQVDIALFVQWVNAHVTGDEKLATFYRRSFTDRFRPAFDEWAEAKPFSGGNAPSSPFVLKSYQLAASEQATQLEAKADVNSKLAVTYIEYANRYLLAIVLLASCLFLAGISTRLKSSQAQRVVLTIGTLVFLATLIWMLTLPVSLA